MIELVNNLVTFSILLLVVILGLIIERKRWFFNISAAVVTIILMAILASLGIVPSGISKTPVPLYSFILTYMLPMSIPLLLFGANLKKIFSQSGRLLKIYLIGSVGVVIGGLLAFTLFKEIIGFESYKLTGVFISTLIGGSVNLVSTSEILLFSDSTLYPSVIAIDNFVVTGFIMLLFIIPNLVLLKKHFRFPIVTNEKTEENEIKDPKAKNTFHLEQFTIAIACSAIITTISIKIEGFLKTIVDIDMDFKILSITIITLLLVNIFPRFFQKLENTSFTIGILFMYLFLGVIGAGTDPIKMIKAGPVMALFCLVMLFTHFLIMLIAGKYLKLNLKEIVIASAANVGGPSISAPLAASLGVKAMITPAILIGILGYAIGTVIGVSVGHLLFEIFS